MPTSDDSVADPITTPPDIAFMPALACRTAEPGDETETPMAASALAVPAAPTPALAASATTALRIATKPLRPVVVSDVLADRLTLTATPPSASRPAVADMEAEPGVATLADITAVAERATATLIRTAPVVRPAVADSAALPPGFVRGSIPAVAVNCALAPTAHGAVSVAVATRATCAEIVCVVESVVVAERSAPAATATVTVSDVVALVVAGATAPVEHRQLAVALSAADAATLTVVDRDVVAESATPVATATLPTVRIALSEAVA